MYPPQPSGVSQNPGANASQASLLNQRQTRFAQPPSPDLAERGAGPGMPTPNTSKHHSRPGLGSRNSSWDLLKRFEHSYEEFDSRNASENHLAFAEGDMPQNKVF